MILHEEDVRDNSLNPHNWFSYLIFIGRVGKKKKSFEKKRLVKSYEKYYLASLKYLSLK